MCVKNQSFSQFTNTFILFQKVADWICFPGNYEDYQFKNWEGIFSCLGWEIDWFFTPWKLTTRHIWIFSGFSFLLSILAPGTLSGWNKPFLSANSNFSKSNCVLSNPAISKVCGLCMYVCILYIHISLCNFVGFVFTAGGGTRCHTTPLIPPPLHVLTACTVDM